MLDLLTTFLVIFLIIPIFHLTSSYADLFTALIILILITIPTVKALINGAPYVPTPFSRVEKMCKMAKINKNSVVYDIGCGDGRIVYMAKNKFGAKKAVGFELSPIVYLLAIIMKVIRGSKAKIVYGNFKHHDLSDANVIFCYLLPDTLAYLEKTLFKELKKGTKIVSYAFKIPNLKLIDSIPKEPKKNLSPIRVYQV